jgi:hypothetical protein
MLKIYLIIISLMAISSASYAQISSREYATEIEPSDYLYGSFVEETDALFDQEKSIDLGINLSSGSDCGRLNFRSSLKGSMKNLLDADYFGDMGKNIVGAAPMLTLCYMSPTWCSIVKSFRANANVMLGARLKQCSLIEKYTDSRVQDYQEERQRCTQKAIAANGGNAEKALEQCQSGNLYQANLPNWAGGQEGSTDSNELIGSSAKWAKFEGAEAYRSLNLLKSLVGDTAISRGSVSVKYGPRNRPLSPRTHLRQVKKSTHAKLCDDLLKDVVEKRHEQDVHLVISNNDLKSLSGESNRILIDRQTIRSLSYMSYRPRMAACRKLSDALALSIFSNDMNKSLDILTTLGQNPNLSKNRKDELHQKRRALKESVELTVRLNEQKNEPLNQVLKNINGQGKKIRQQVTKKQLNGDSDYINSRKTHQLFNDCTDGIMCGRR